MMGRARASRAWRRPGVGVAIRWTALVHRLRHRTGSTMSSSHAVSVVSHGTTAARQRGGGANRTAEVQPGRWGVHAVLDGRSGLGGRTAPGRERRQPGKAGLAGMRCQPGGRRPGGRPGLGGRQGRFGWWGPGGRRALGGRRGRFGWWGEGGRWGVTGAGGWGWWFGESPGVTGACSAPSAQAAPGATEKAGNFTGRAKAADSGDLCSYRFPARGFSLRGSRAAARRGEKGWRDV
jgi:hypothetical protein